LLRTSSRPPLRIGALAHPLQTGVLGLRLIADHLVVDADTIVAHPHAERASIIADLSR
jgi:hypothetical protein